MFGGETRILSTTDRGNTGVRGLTDPAFSSGGHGMSFTPFYRAPSSVSIDRFMLRQSLFFIYLFLLAISPRPPSRAHRHQIFQMANGLQ